MDISAENISLVLNVVPKPKYGPELQDTDKLLDFIAMDLKAPLGKYEQVVGISHLELASVLESVEIIKSCGLAYEFRTTLCLELETDDIPIISSIDYFLAALAGISEQL